MIFIKKWCYVIFNMAKKPYLWDKNLQFFTNVTQITNFDNSFLSVFTFLHLWPTQKVILSGVFKGCVMLKKFLFLAVATATSLFAQTHFGASAAFTMSDWFADSDNSYTTGMGVGVTASGIARYDIQKNLVALGALGLAFRNVGYEEINYKSLAIEFPLTIRYTFYKNWNIEAGPQASFAFFSHWTFDSGDQITDNENKSHKAMFDERSFEFDVLAGLGYTFTQQIDVYARFVLGLTNLFKDWHEPIYETDHEMDIQHMQFQFGAHYWFM